MELFGAENSEREHQVDYHISFEDGSEAYLEHYGTKGMHWGVWNAETASRYRGGDSTKSGSRKTVRQLNKLDQRRAVEVGKRYEAEKKADKLSKKSAKASNSEKAAKLSAKAKEQTDIGSKHDAAAKGIEKHQQQLMRKAVAEGYSIKTKDIRRSTLTKGEKAVQIALNAAAYAAGSPMLVTYDRKTAGTRYRLKKKDSTYGSKPAGMSDNFKVKLSNSYNL